MNIKNTIRNTHLALGLVSGIIVFIIAITGSLYAFHEEITSLTEKKFRNVLPQDKPFLPPSELKKIADGYFPGKEIHGIAYNGKDKATEVVFYEDDPVFYYGLFINPYSGEILKAKNQRSDFFNIILTGHFYLWLPPFIGKPVVATATLVFVIILLLGIIIWWPQKKTVARSFRIKWNANIVRKLFDIHSVLGVYAVMVLLVIALTGLVWGFEWFSKAVYEITGGDKSLEFTIPHSNKANTQVIAKDQALDSIWYRLYQEYPNAPVIEVHLVHNDTSAFYAHIKQDVATYWRTDYRFFDQHTLKEIAPDHIYGRFGEASSADILRRLNYDIHVGAIGGVPGKILVFFAGLIAASLPVTGFLYWRRQRKEKLKLLKGLDV
jgi:uncharacterized iron-regulated membrane protein